MTIQGFPKTFCVVLVLLRVTFICPDWISDRLMNDWPVYSGVVDTVIELPCNATPPSSNDNVTMILWFKDDATHQLGHPVYTIDARNTGNIATAEHFSESNRVTFDMSSPVAILRFNPVKEQDQGGYRCRVDFRRGRTISFGIKLDVIVKPKEVRITIISPIGKMVADRPTHLVCHSSGSRPSAHIEWRVGSVPLHSFKEQTSADGSVTTSYLSYVPSIDDNAKELSCIATNTRFGDQNGQNSILDSLKLDIYHSPLVYLAMGSSLQSEKILVESDVFFECNVKANPMVDDLGWKLNGKPLMANKSGNVLVRNDSVLIKNVQKQNEGRYECWATNVAGKGESEPIDLNVQYAPVCVPRGNQKIYAAAIGEQIKVSCDIDANPGDVKFHWILKSIGSKNTQTSSTESSQSSESLKLKDFTEEGFSSILNFVPKKLSDYGELLCWAVNSAGSQREPCRYIIASAEKPGLPENCTVANITMDSFTVSCQPGYNGGLPSSYSLELYQDDGENSIQYNQSAEDYPFFVLKSLASGNAYIIKVYTVNAKGRSDDYILRASTQFQALWHADIIEDDTVPPTLAGLIAILGTFILIGCLAVHRLRKRSEHIKNSDQKMKMRISNGRQTVSGNGEEFYNLDDFKSEMQYDSMKNFCVNHVNLCDLNDDYFTTQNNINMVKNGEDRPHGIDNFNSLLDRDRSFDDNDTLKEINHTQNLINTTRVCDCCPDSTYSEDKLGTTFSPL
ncbi:neural cell adhesion molecule 2-like isoform X2 [Brevipalpus obovatus]|uniref:neural cell adhesion molecule 2-like isoform X2 n=1 Tax=Brevipalpus obovatus TaxID=246614 RepID=UPI003D9F555B